MIISSLLVKLICVNKKYHTAWLDLIQYITRQNIHDSCVMFGITAETCEGVAVLLCKVLDDYYALQISQFSNHYKQVALPPWLYYCNYCSDSIVPHGYAVIA